MSQFCWIDFYGLKFYLKTPSQDSLDKAQALGFITNFKYLKSSQTHQPSVSESWNFSGSLCIVSLKAKIYKMWSKREKYSFVPHKQYMLKKQNKQDSKHPLCPVYFFLICKSKMYTESSPHNVRVESMINCNLIRGRVKRPSSWNDPQRWLFICGVSKQGHIWGKERSVAMLTWCALMQFIKQISQTFIFQSGFWLEWV